MTTEVSVPGEYAGALKGDNILLKALNCFSSHTQITVPLLKIHLEKKIPIGAGMGGGSSDAAAILCFLQEQKCPEMRKEMLISIALGVGADVPFFIEKKAAFVSGIGENVAYLDSFPSIPAIMVYPNVSVITQHIFKRGFSVFSERSIVAENIPRTLDEVLDFLKHETSNDLTYNAVKEAPVIAEVLWTLQRLPGCRLARMTGSGAACMALFSLS